MSATQQLQVTSVRPNKEMVSANLSIVSPITTPDMCCLIPTLSLNSLELSLLNFLPSTYYHQPFLGQHLGFHNFFFALALGVDSFRAYKWLFLQYIIADV